MSASHGRGVSCCGPRAPGARASGVLARDLGCCGSRLQSACPIVVARRLCRSGQVGSSWTRDRADVPLRWQGDSLPLSHQGSPRLQSSCLKNPRDRGAWLATIHGIAKGRTPLSTRVSYDGRRGGLLPGSLPHIILSVPQEATPLLGPLWAGVCRLSSAVTAAQATWLLSQHTRPPCPSCPRCRQLGLRGTQRLTEG